MFSEILLTIIGALFTLLVGLVVYVWVSSEKRSEKRLGEINEKMAKLSEALNSSVDKIYCEIRKVGQQGVDAEKRMLEYQIHAEERYAHKEEVRELKNGLRLART